MPVIAKLWLFVMLRLPLDKLVAFKLETTLILFSVVPPLELRVSKLPLIKPAPASEITPVLVNDTLPLVLMLPAFSVVLRPAVELIAPEVLETVAL